MSERVSLHLLAISIIIIIIQPQNIMSQVRPGGFALGGGGGDQTANSYGNYGNFGNYESYGSYGNQNQVGTYGNHNQVGSNGNQNQDGSYGNQNQVGSYGNQNQVGSYGNQNQVGSYGNQNQVGSFGNGPQAGRIPRPGGILLGTAKPPIMQTLIPPDRESLQKRMEELIDQRREKHKNPLTVDERLNEFEFEAQLSEWKLHFWQWEIECIKTIQRMIQKEQNLDEKYLKELNVHIAHLSEAIEKQRTGGSNPDKTKLSVLIPRNK